MRAFPPQNETWMVTLECLSHLPGPRFLDGRVLNATTGLAPHAHPPYTGTYWAVSTLAPGIVKFRCMTHAQGNRFLDGRTNDGGVGLAPMRGVPLTGERWAATEHDGFVTLQCLGIPPNQQFQFLDGRTLDGTVGLAPTTDFPFSGTYWRVRMHGKIVVFHCTAPGFAPNGRFLDGRLIDGTVGLAPMALGRFTGTRWLLKEDGGAVTLKCLGELPYDNRFLDGDLRAGQGTVRLAPHTEPPMTGTHWELIEHDYAHVDVEPGKIVSLKCLADVPSDYVYLDGIIQSGQVGLAKTSAPPFTGTRWRMLPAGLYWEPCPRAHEHQLIFGPSVHVQ